MVLLRELKATRLWHPLAFCDALEIYIQVTLIHLSLPTKHRSVVFPDIWIFACPRRLNEHTKGIISRECGGMLTQIFSKSRNYGI